MQPEACSTTYQCAFQWPSSVPPKGNHPSIDRPQTVPQNKMNLPVVCKEFAKSFECGCKKNSKAPAGNKKSSLQNCIHVNVFMPYQVNFNNIPVGKKMGKDGLNAYIYGSERKEAIQAAAMNCTQRPEPNMRDINKKVDIKLQRPKNTPHHHQDPCALAHGKAQYQSITKKKEEPLCLTLDELKKLAEFVGTDGGKKIDKGNRPKTSCNCGKP